MKGLVLAGGSGTRLRPLTYGFAKQLIPVANKPVLFYALSDMQRAGIDDIVINVAPQTKDDVISAVGDGSSLNIKVRYNLQEEPAGIAHAIKIARDLIGDDSFVVYLGDNILRNGIKPYVNKFRESDADAIALVARVANPERFGTVDVEGSRVTRIVEKPVIPTSNLAMVGVYLLRPSIFDAIDRLKPSRRNELEIVEAYQDLIDRGSKVEAVEVDGWWADTGTPEDLLEANRTMLKDLDHSNLGSAKQGVLIEGKVAIGRGTIIERGSRIVGPAIIGDNCIIGPDARIGPYTSIGNNVRLASCEIENSIIMDGSLIDFSGKLLESILGKETVIERGQESLVGMRLVVGQKSKLSL